MKFTEYIGSQFGNPHGIIGIFCCAVMNLINRAQYRGALDSLRCSHESRVLDIGFGNGHLIQRIFNRYHCYIDGIDISPDMVHAALKRNKKGVDSGKIQLQLGNCLFFPYKANTFDQAVTVNTIYFWESIEKGLSEIFRVLKPGGSFINAVYSKDFLAGLSYSRKGFTLLEAEEIKAASLAAGFSSVVCKQLKHGRCFIIICTK